MASPLRAPLILMAVLALASAATPKQSPRLLGGLQEANVNEEGVQRAVDFAISEYNKGSNDAYHSRAMQVLRARKQVSVPRCPLLSGSPNQAPLARARFASAETWPLPPVLLTGAVHLLPCFSALLNVFPGLLPLWFILEPRRALRVGTNPLSSVSKSAEERHQSCRLESPALS